MIYFAFGFVLVLLVFSTFRGGRGVQEIRRLQAHVDSLLEMREAARDLIFQEAEGLEDIFEANKDRLAIAVEDLEAYHSSLDKLRDRYGNEVHVTVLRGRSTGGYPAGPKRAKDRAPGA